MSDQPESPTNRPHRRKALKALAGLGIGTAVFHRALAAQTENAAHITAEMVKQIIETG